MLLVEKGGRGSFSLEMGLIVIHLRDLNKIHPLEVWFYGTSIHCLTSFILESVLESSRHSLADAKG